MPKILIINPFGIGDVLFTTPLIANIKGNDPKSQVFYLANRRTEEFLRHDTQVARVFTYERDEFVALYRKNPLLFFNEWHKLWKSIQQERFDAVLDISMNSTFGFLAKMAGIPKRIGFDYKGRGRFLTDKLPLSGYEGRHVVEYYADLLKPLAIAANKHPMKIHTSLEAVQWAQNWVKEQKIPSSKPIIAVFPGGGASWGAGAKFKRWPIEKYADLVDKIIAKTGAAIILMGDKKEAELGEQLMARVKNPVYSLMGQTSLMQTAAFFKSCRLAIVNDGGPLHMAVASGTKTVSIFGPVDPHVYGPYPQEGHAVAALGLPCQPCYRRFRMAACSHLRCLNDLSVEDVFRKVESAL